MRILGCLLFTVFIFSTTSFAWSSWVGVLEDWPINPSVPQAGGAGRRVALKYENRIRPLFIRNDQKQWQAAPRPGEAEPIAVLPKAFSWDVCFSGRSEGQLTGNLVVEGMPSTSPPYVLRPEDRAPWRTRRALDYAGWLGTPVYKPILLLSSLNSSCKDSEKWRRAGSETVKKNISVMTSELRKSFAAANPGTVQYEFDDKNVKVVQSWVSPKNGLFVSLKTVPKSPDVETFQVSRTGEVTYSGRNMIFIDAGDFDGDGVTELLFRRHGNKKDVYLLFTKGSKVAESIWDYR
jgi:hypothetical protein